MSAAAWHTQSIADVLNTLGTGADGLSAPEAAARLQRNGPNRLPPPQTISAGRILRDQLTSIVVYLLVAAAALSAMLGDWPEAAAVAVVLIINTAIGFTTELRARRAMDALLQFDVVRASVLRDGRLVSIDAADLVTGDVVQLNAGQQVPADARLSEGTDLRTIEAALTGESLPVEKQSASTLDADTPLADRTNMVFKGTSVAAGAARAIVTATGVDTEIGRVATLVGGIEEERTPLERRLDALGGRLVWMALGVATLVSALALLQGAPIDVVLKTGIALAVAAVPEALPAVATIALAVGLRRMARRKALVRRLPAVESLGSTTIVCTDKTRTLTSGVMTVARLWTAGAVVDITRGPVADPAVRRSGEAALLASRPQATQPGQDAAPTGDPVDVALAEAAERLSIDRRRLIEQRPLKGDIPFSSDRQFAASFHGDDRRIVASVKGAPRRILTMSARTLAAEGEIVLDERGREAVIAANDQLAADGFRVLAIADGPVDAPDEKALKDLTFLALVGLIDPPAPGVKETIDRLKGAGLRTIMLTGDQRLTAQAIGRDLGVLREDEEVLDGRELEALSEQQLQEKLSRVGAFSRVSPEHKLTIVTALQARHEVVAMLGDGVNDAAALKKADVGVAMGRGTDVAKESAAMVLQDDRFETIAIAVEEGRIIYENIRKFVLYLFSCNLAEVLVLLGAGVFGLPLPLLPLQILWLNMVTDTFPALALAMERGDADVMRRPPRRPDEAILSRAFTSQVVLYAALITASTLAAFLWALSRAPEQATTVSFMTLALAQIFHLGNARSGRSVLTPAQIFSNRYAILALVVSVGLQLAALYLDPLPRVLALEPLDRSSWTVVLLAALTPAIAGQLLKLLRPGPNLM